jgi:hypothetical protein
MCVCVYVYAVCDGNYISPHFLSYVLYKRKYCEFTAGSTVYEPCHGLHCVQIYICFHETFVRAVVTNKHKLVHISVLIFISALLSDPQAGQLYFIPGTGSNFSYHHLVQTDTEIQHGSYVLGAGGALPV